MKRKTNVTAEELSGIKEELDWHTRSLTLEIERESLERFRKKQEGK